jgi:membrane-bound ClpP family serine protease
MTWLALQTAAVNLARPVATFLAQAANPGAATGSASAQPNPNQAAYLTWGLICLAVAVILFILEVFVPSAGIIALSASAALVAGIVLLFLNNSTLGIAAAIAALVALPFFFIGLLRLWPNTPIFRLLLLKNAPGQTVVPSEAPTRSGGFAGGSGGGTSGGGQSGGPGNPGNPGNPGVGQRGKAISDLRPVGTCLIDGKRVECLAEGGMIPVGAKVRVTSVQGMEVKVREEV